MSCQKEKPKDNDEIKQMTMTTSKSSVGIDIAGEGTFTIDWGDGSKIETYKLSAYNSDDWFHWQNRHKYKHYHLYSEEVSRTIIITGENITHLSSQYNRLTGLDVTKNRALTYLTCHVNQLTNLDISKNTKLTILGCGDNQLTSLDVNKNTKLIHLYCGNNQLANLDVSKNIALSYLNIENNQITNLVVSNNTELTYLNCSINQLTNLDATKNIELINLVCFSNQLSKEALDALFETLPRNEDYKTISIGNNPGTSSCNRNILAEKGWFIIDDW